jgi:hypothetical protein
MQAISEYIGPFFLCFSCTIHEDPVSLIKTHAHSPAGTHLVSTTAHNMAHKHNRRRIRPRSRNHNTFANHFLLDRSLFSKPGIASGAEPPNPSTCGIYPGTADSHSVNLDQALKTPKRSQNIYPACQTRTQRQIEETAKLELERIKLFGGLPGDDVGLCYRMLEYFGGLDFIDT